jgi:hypothetical protein
VGTSRIYSLATSSFTEEHASSGERQWRASSPSGLPSSSSAGHHQENSPSRRKHEQPVRLQLPLCLLREPTILRAWQHSRGFFPHTGTDARTEQETSLPTVPLLSRLCHTTEICSTSRCVLRRHGDIIVAFDAVSGTHKSFSTYHCKENIVEINDLLHLTRPMKIAQSKMKTDVIAFSSRNAILYSG